MKRRSFLKSGLLWVPAVAMGQVVTPLRRPASFKPLHPTEEAWYNGIITAGGSTSSFSLDTRTAVSNFCYALDDSNLTAKMLSVNIMYRALTGGSLFVLSYPLIHVLGSNPYGNSNLGDVSVVTNGLFCNSTGRLDTGVLPGSIGMANLGISAIVYGATFNSAFQIVVGTANAGGVAGALIGINNTDHLYAQGYVAASQLATSETSILGYISANRSSTTSFNFYHANLATPHRLIGSYTTSDTTAAWNKNFYIGDLGIEGQADCCLFTGTVSFTALHYALNASESSALFQASYALRTALGGGTI